ncbi:Helix-turn-helix domain-containing protein [Chryseobacterium wanjuense]|uniref:Helix-turn-helix domain-containing protein n=1 Tax=Chryseobacterium wanjuense TaxID=356305 RepID=A0A1I0QBX0_9FLAO|nr:helix-turn-helix domain-containing protein [Chryseobacterium wanjuense]SEW24540.1 Helix-turn-helix domain-containing protein [Chryseobacterium wanjuense]
MSIFSDNIRFLRTQKNLSQQEIADDLSMSRVRYSKYEDGRSEAPYEILIRISKYVNISIDLLLTVDIRKYSLENILKLPDNRIVLPVIVDPEGNNFIEIIPHKASMGYLTGYSDPGYIESLQRISLPFLSNGKYRAFPADGDSMPPFMDGSYIIGKYVEKLQDLKPGKAYIFVTRNEGITYKTLMSGNKKSITVCADNSFYDPYEILLSDILEVWLYVWGLLPEDYRKYNSTDSMSVQDMFLELRKDIKKLNEKL